MTTTSDGAIIGGNATTSVLKINPPTAVTANQLNFKTTGLVIDMGSLVATNVAKVAFNTAAMAITYRFKAEAVLIGSINTTTGIGEAKGTTLDYVVAATGTDAQSAAWTNFSDPAAPYVVVTGHATATDLVQTITVKTAD